MIEFKDLSTKLKGTESESLVQKYQKLKGTESLDEKYAKSMGYTNCEKAMSALSPYLDPKSALCKSISSSTDNVVPEFKKMQKHMDSINELWESIEQTIAMTEGTTGLPEYQFGTTGLTEKFDAKKLHSEISKIKLPGFENRYAHEALASLLAAVKKAKKFADYQDEYEEIGNSINRPHAIEILHLVDKHGR
jgi:hypothetical protein|tara:strand:- start:818 stop:1393 length:576 start_codon:yes stop_codon:yes gene_type:complete